MPFYPLYAIVILTIVYAFIVTVKIAKSKKTTKGNPEYDKKAKQVLVKMTIYYLITVILAAIPLMYYLLKHDLHLY
jgi:heme/copper-type cytochrome/quinol oxidase subunit 2